MSTISGVSPASYTPALNQVKSAPVKSQQATPPVQPVVTDADGDNDDGTKGGKIDIHV